MPRIEVKLFFPLGRVVNKKSTGTVSFYEEIEQGETLGSVLSRLAGRYTGLQEVFNVASQDLNPYVLIVLNDIVLTYPHKLGAELKDGDSLSLLPEFSGG
ncbi:MAG: MoaD/ThiS family protein [Dehalococcoidia bacterium]|nr:MoaD/ThiS family protein [Dehalococcoidia bacterium]